MISEYFPTICIVCQDRSCRAGSLKNTSVSKFNPVTVSFTTQCDVMAKHIDVGLDIRKLKPGNCIELRPQVVLHVFSKGAFNLAVFDDQGIFCEQSHHRFCIALRQGASISSQRICSGGSMLVLGLLCILLGMAFMALISLILWPFRVSARWAGDKLKGAIRRVPE